MAWKIQAFLTNMLHQHSLHNHFMVSYLCFCNAFGAETPVCCRSIVWLACSLTNVTLTLTVSAILAS